MKHSRIFAILLFLCLVSVVSAANYTSTFDSTDIVKMNQSYIQDPTSGNTTPYYQWVLSGLIALILIVIALIKPRLYHMDYEINIIVSVMAWPFLWYWTWGGLGSLDLIVGTAMTTTTNASILITQHILYSWWVLGWIGVAANVFAIGVTILLVAQFNLFKEKEEQERVANERAERTQRMLNQ
jgi:hypothetical protein